MFWSLPLCVINFSFISCAEKPKCVRVPATGGLSSSPPKAFQVYSIGVKSFIKSKPKSVVAILSLKFTSDVCIVPFVALTSSHLKLSVQKSFELLKAGAKC